MVVMLAAAALSATFATDVRADPPETDPASIAERRAARTACLNDCGEQYKTCVQRSEAKQPGACGGSAVRCRQKCPPRVETKAQPVVAPAREQRAAPEAESAPARETRPVTPAVESAPAREARPGVPAAEPAPAPASAPIQPASGRPAAAVSPVTPSAAAPPVSAAGEPDAAKRQQRIDSERVTSESAAARDEAASKRSRRNWLKSAWCLLGPCEEDEETPSCTDVCSADYHDCVTLGNKQRQQTCATDVAHCKERCAAGQPASPAR